HVGAVRVAAAGHRDVEVLSGRCGFDDHVRGVCGDALCPVRRHRVAEVDMLAYVGGRQDDGPAVSPARSADGDRPVVADSGDGPTFAVADPVVAVAQAPVVAAGDDRVSNTCGGAVMEIDLATGRERAVEDQVSPGALVQFGHIVTGLCDQHRYEAPGSVGAPCGIGGVDHLLCLTACDAVVVEVGVDHLSVAVPQPQGRGLLPLVGEPVDVE